MADTVHHLARAMTLAEIATKLGVSTETLRMRIMRAKRAGKPLWAEVPPLNDDPRGTKRYLVDPSTLNNPQQPPPTDTRTYTPNEPPTVPRTLDQDGQGEILALKGHINALNAVIDDLRASRDRSEVRVQELTDRLIEAKTQAADAHADACTATEEVYALREMLRAHRSRDTWVRRFIGRRRG